MVTAASHAYVESNFAGLSPLCVWASLLKVSFPANALAIPRGRPQTLKLLGHRSRGMDLIALSFSFSLLLLTLALAPVVVLVGASSCSLITPASFVSRGLGKELKAGLNHWVPEGLLEVSLHWERAVWSL